MLAYARNLPFVSSRDGFSDADLNGTFGVYALASNILAIAYENPKFNNTVIPALHLFNIMLEGNVFSVPEGRAGGLILDL